jgi:hypothetical protein
MFPAVRSNFSIAARNVVVTLEVTFLPLNRFRARSEPEFMGSKKAATHFHGSGLLIGDSRNVALLRAEKMTCHGEKIVYWRLNNEQHFSSLLQSLFARQSPAHGLVKQFMANRKKKRSRRVQGQISPRENILLRLRLSYKLSIQ